MDQDNYEELNELVCSTIELSVSDALLFNIKSLDFAYGSGQTPRIVYLEKCRQQSLLAEKVYGFGMKVGTPMSTHLSELNSIFSQMVAFEIRY